MNKNLLRQRLSVMLVALTTCLSMQSQTFTHYSEWMAYTQKSYVYNSDYWRYDDGLMYESILDTYEQYKNGSGNFTDETLKNAVKTYIDACVKSDGSITNYKSGDLDDIRPARMVYKYYKLYGGDNLKKACQTVMACNAFKDNVRVIDQSTGYPWQHKSDYANQVWLDGIFMGIPYWTLAGPDSEFGSSLHTDWTANDYFDDAVSQMQKTDEKTYEPTIGLWCHAWDATSPISMFWATKTGSFLTNDYKNLHSDYELIAHDGRSSHCWGRALGWYAMAIMETMDNIAAVNGASDSRISTLKALFKKVMDKVVETRDPSAGVWRCVIDVDATLSPYKDYSNKNNYLEATCSAMFTYCLLHGVAQGYLDSSYLPVAKDSYNKFITQFITNNGTNLSMSNCMSVGGLGPNSNTKRDGSYAYYMSESIVNNDSKGVGPFIWASLEAEKTYGYTIGSGFSTAVANNEIVQFRWSKVAEEATVGNYTSPTFTAKTLDGTAVTTGLSFSSDNTSVATVASDGTVSLVGAGTATITATHSSYAGEAKYTVVVKAADTTAPTLSSTTPAGNATDIATSGTVVLTFDEAVTVANASGITISPSTGVTWGTATVDASDNKKVNITYSGLSNSTQYTVTIANNAITDASGNAYAGSNFSFTTKEASTETTFFSFEVNSTGDDIYVARQGGTQELTTTNAFSSLTGGSVTIKNENTSSGGPDKMVGKDNNERHIRFTNTNQCVIINLNQKLAAGDIIAFSSNGSAQISFTTTDSRATTISTSNGSYTIPTGSALINVSTLYVWPASTSTKIKTFTITHTVSSSAPVAPTFAPTTGAKVKSGTTVTATSSTSGSTVYYKWSSTALTAAEVVSSGTAGTTGAATVTTTGITSSATTLYAVAVKDGTNSTLSTATYTIDDTAPTLSSSTPTNGATGVAVSGNITLTFSENVTIADASKFTLSGGTLGTPTVSGATVTLPYSGLSNGTAYTLSTAAGAVQDAVGNTNAALSNISFTTATAATTTLTAESDKTWDFTSSTQFTQAASADYKFETYTVSDNIGIGSNTVLKTETTGSSGKPQRLMLSGNNTSNSSGVSSTQESVHFKVAAHSKITVNAVGGANRNIKIDSGTFGTGTNLLSSAITSSSRADFTAYYNGDSETDIYIYESTGNGNITLYSITVEPTYALTKGTETNGTFTLSPSDRAAAGETITVTTTPASGYEVSAVTTTPSTTVTTVTADSKYTFTMPTQATTVNVTFTTAAAPELSISTQPTGASYTQNATATALTVSATGGTSPYTYQWYSNSSNSTTGATAISNATSASYTPSTATVGTIYYYCIVTDAASATVTSNIVAVTVSAASSSTSYTLVSDPTGTPALTSDFLIGSLTLNQNTAATIDDIAFKKAIKFGSSLSSISGKNVGDNNICYDVKTSSTKFTIYVSGGTGTLYFSKIAEGENSTTAESKTISTNPQKLEFTLSSTTNTRVGFSSSNTSMYIYQIVAEETGTAHKQAGEAGYVLNLNKGRYSGNKTSSNSGKTGKIDNIEIVSYNSYTHTNTTALELSKNTADTYVKFTTGTSPSKLKVTFSTGTLIANTSASTTGGTALTSNTAQALSANTTYYIINTNGSRASITNIAFEAATEAKVATPTITPADGTVFEGTTQSVSISCGTSGASIYYTDDGTEPTTSSTAYSSAFTIYGTKTIKAIAVKSGMTNSDVATATITNTCLNEYNATDGTLILKEAATEYTPIAATGVDVTLVRTLQANKWNALCLPFDVTPAMFSNATNGAETQIETLQQVKNNTFIFAAVNEVAAGTPFIAKPVANIANPVFEDVQIKAVSAGTVTKDEYSFKGNYTKVTLDPTIHLFISMSQQKLVSPTGSNILQGLRGYFIVPEGSDAKAGLDFDGEVIVTDIDQLNAEHLPFVIDDNTPIYNLSGQRVSKSYKGIVIIKGKKIVR